MELGNIDISGELVRMKLLESCNCIEKDGMEAKIPGRIAERLRSREGKGVGFLTSRTISFHQGFGSKLSLDS